MSDDERPIVCIGFKVTPSQRAELDKLQAETGCSTRSELMRIITSAYLVSHKDGSSKHVNQELTIDETGCNPRTCPIFKTLVTRLQAVLADEIPVCPEKEVTCLISKPPYFSAER